jgi:quinol monooxygenase YgiN
MVIATFTHKVNDFDSWLKVFREHESMRARYGCKGSEVLRSLDDSKNVTIVCKWDSAENLEKFGKSQDLKEVMEKAGVVSEPVVHVYTSAGCYAA